MSNIKCVHDEYQRLSASLGIEKLDDSKKVLVEELVKQASFLLVELDILKEQIDIYGAIQVNKNGRQKLNCYQKPVLCYTASICMSYLMKDKKKKRLWIGEFKLKLVIDIMVKSLADLIKTIDGYIY